VSAQTAPDSDDLQALTWPLTGRGEEMRVIDAALSAPDLSGITIHGVAGVGKSRIAREALIRAGGIGCEIRWAIATSAARTVPLGAFAEWAGPSFADTLQLVRGVIESLTSADPGTTVVVGIDDAQFLDDLSIFVLHQIVQQNAAKVVMTVRTGEPIPAGIREVWKVGRFDRLDLQPLSQDETTRLLSETLKGPLDLTDARRLWALTRGNPLYLRTIVEQEITHGRLSRLCGSWRWSGDPVVPPSLVELIESRFGTLPARVADVIDTLAVGEPLELAALRRIADRDSIEEADTRGLITLEPLDGRIHVRLAHPLYGEVRRKCASPIRLRRLRGMVVDELTASGNSDDIHILVRRATLSLDSDLQLDRDVLTRAAQGAVWLLDLPLADRLADAAVRAGAVPEANFLRAHVLSSLSRGEECEALLAETLTGQLTDVEHALLAFLRAINRLFPLADPVGAKRVIDDASRDISKPAGSLLDAFLTVYWAAMGKPQAAINASTTISWDTLPDVPARFTAWAMTVALGDAGRTAEAAAAAQSGYPVPVRGFVIITDAHVGALLLSGQIVKAQQQADLLRQRVATVPGPGQLQSDPVAGRAALGAGHLDAATSLLAPMVAALSASGETIRWAYRCQIPLTIALAMRGLTEEAIAALTTLENLRHPGWRYLDYEREIAQAWVAACQGAVSQAIKTVLAAAATACDRGQFAPEVMCLQTAAQFGDASGSARLHELAAIVEGPRARLAARFASALRAGNTAELVNVSEEFERIGDLVAALDAAAHAAIAYRRMDLRGSALSCSTRADALAAQCGGARTPALRQASQRLPLTQRETEIAMLLGEGLPSSAIARRLTLSVRTVEGHIYRAMAKTGTVSRDELAALLPRHTPTSG
jgi:DNA-binding CsgD family transcriptional regulator